MADTAIRLRASAAVIKDRKILLVPHYYANGSSRWYLPGGRVEHLEPLNRAAVREFREETGLDIERLCLLEVVESVKPDRASHSVTVVYTATIVGGSLRAEDTSSAAYGDKTPRWFGEHELPDVVDYLTPTVIKAFRLSVG